MSDAVMVPETETQYEVWQDDCMVASADTLSDAQHYSVIYGQDGPVKEVTAVTTRFPGFNIVSAMLAASTPVGGWGEPVAWTNRANLEILRSGRGAATMWPSQHATDSTPLYAAPPPPSFSTGSRPQEAVPTEQAAPPVVSDDGWIKWSGGENPVPGRRVSTRFRDFTLDEQTPSPSERWPWNHVGGSYDIIAYRILPQTEKGSDTPPVKTGAGEMAFPTEKDDPIQLARVSYLSEDRVTRGLADAMLRGLTVQAQLRQAAALERIADTMDGTASGLCITEPLIGGARNP